MHTQSQEPLLTDFYDFINETIDALFLSPVSHLQTVMRRFQQCVKFSLHFLRLSIADKRQ